MAGRLAIKELRFVFCQTSSHSNGVRRYIMNNYEAVKAANPQLPFIVRECQNAQATVMARYDFGVEKRMYINHASEEEVAQAVDELAGQAEQINSSVAANPQF
uniref:Ribosomal protein/NADH dehydrogenase domain-containing protein n=1 Tax=Strombidinopsis acuminata TaxID=141414 RepID=A0A7S3S874_9SPIT|mmetsp:Transcript_23901/g.32548  ORF Transcript_23901/g.32548 Transcript_23901/m.32548 type:complete len:103 (+) Transcript_23901:17-325(+)|eukprot:CAMPEP_0176376898 /NCGR_PEP_ID=MMETSP0126-20121128/28504_1 /TAXON_ID=141414 ORGANISM="Strombidinopsis acuminatum, Strain SPMC142" /NCGR_SAMPLE_ID=MMETSP0126 /ASSEMBLY_ACC=CAM_ASM_000229 /LENGTH=102 /DNA_ID=CAMNT_0017738507 /DNA_START=17 /DNA_END=325 /DNA_ORIENTATION=+